MPKNVVSAPTPPSLHQLFLYWLKLGFISFGGPAGQIALMHTDLVEKKRWISEQRFLHALNYCMLLPGPEATQLAIYLTWLLHGTVGGVMAGVLFFLPAFLLLSLLAGLYLSWGHLPLMQGIFYGMKPAVVAIVLFAAWRIGTRTLKNPVLWSIAALAFSAIFFLHLSFPWIVLGAALLGIIGGKFLPTYFQAKTTHHAAKASVGAAVIDDHTPTPTHALFTWKKLYLTVGAFLLLWGGVMLLIRPQPTLAAMGWFFTKAAFLTIGGAYAVLPYVYQGSVEHYAWLTGLQMMDGLALGETTPGPLIMVVTWIGYVGGVTKTVVEQPMLAGLLGASVTTFFTFLPSFLFIFVGGPLVEATRHNLTLTAPLTAITAAVVGVIVNLGVFFAWHTFFPHATDSAVFQGGLDGFAVALAAAAFIALWRYQRDVMLVIATSALIGLGYTLLA